MEPQVTEQRQLLSRYFTVQGAGDAEDAQAAVAQYLSEGDLQPILGDGLHPCTPLLAVKNAPGDYTVVVGYSAF